MTIDTPQPATAGETEVVSTQDQLSAAANAFKVALGQDEPTEQPRDEKGRFTAQQGEEEEIEAAGEGEPTGEPQAGADDSQDEEEDGSEAAEEAQPSDPLPKSWNPDKAELWSNLDPDAQAYIRQRDAEQESAVNAKFMEAANLKRAHEAEVMAATQQDRQRYADAVDQVLSLVVPQAPPKSMLDPNSNDYDPDAWHYRKTLHEETVAFLTTHAAQRQQLAAQEQATAFNAINDATRDAFMKAVPDVADQAKAPAVFDELIKYATGQGAPESIFATPTTALEWHILWKAKEYDRLQAAKTRITSEPKPAQRKAAPPLRPGVTTPRSAIEQQNRRGAMDRLRKEGSVEAGAAALKHLLKGQIS